MLRRKLFAVIFMFVFYPSAICQLPQRHFNKDSIPDSYFDILRKEYGYKKIYPAQFEKQILIALSYYPELKNIPIRFRTKSQHAAAFTRITWTGILESSGNRHYVVTISDSTEEMLMPLLFKNLPFNAQIGLIGHELGHVVDSSTATTSGILKHVVSSISTKHIDHFEYNTDAICIAHGLGYQLLEWSRYVRKIMHSENWDGPDYAHRPKKRERYMNPSTIEKRIEENPIYNSIR